MGLGSTIIRGGDTVYAARFLRLLTMPWNKTGAFKQGIVDANGKKLKEPETSQEKAAYTVFHRLAFNLKRLINKLPGGKGNIASYASALYLLHEETGMEYEDMEKVLEHVTGVKMSGGETQDEIIILSEAAFADVCGNTITQADIDIFCEDVLAGAMTTAALPPLPTQLFKVPNKVFKRFATGRNKYERWKKYLDLDDPDQKAIREYARKYPNRTICLECQDTGALRAIRKRSSNML